MGVILARGNEFLFGQGSAYAIVMYIIGVGLGLGGLVVVGSSLSKTYEQMVQCPECFTLNSLDAKKCVKCSKPLIRPDSDIDAPGETGEDEL